MFFIFDDRLLMEYVIGVDIGTTHCKCVALTPGGEVLLQVQASYPTIQHIQGQSEQEPDIIFNRVLELLHKTIVGLKDEYELKAVAFSSAMHSIVPVDKSGIPLTNAFTWADTRSNAYAMELIENGQQSVLYPRVGVPIHPMLPLCKIMWIRHSMPTIFSLAKKFISIKEYVFHKLFGKYIVDYSIACASGLFNILEMRWDQQALQLAGIDDHRLSLPVTVFHAETKLREEYRNFFGLNDVPFIIGGSDGCLANIGSGAVEAGEGAITIGTSGAVRIVASQSNPDPLHRLFNYAVEKDFFVCGGPVNNGGIILKWFAENLLDRRFESNSDFSSFIDEASQIQPGANGLIFLPYLLGERAPYWDSNLRGGFIGLDIMHRKEHMMRAVLEGVSFGLCSVMNAIESAYGEIKVLYASGGFTQSRQWLQMMADIMNKRIVVAGGADASTLGAAVIGFCAIGLMKDIRQAKDLVNNHAEFQPDSKNNDVYKKAFNVFQNLAPLLKEQFPLLRQDQ
jgi:gluconokinase